MFVPKDVEDVAIKDTILQQNNLSHIEDPVLNIKLTKGTFEDSRHVVIEVSPNLRRELVALRKIKLHWSTCRFEDFVVVTRCLKCLGFGHTSRFCQKIAHAVLKTITGKNAATSTLPVALTVSKPTPTSTTTARK
jgi:hypothetical protein